MGRHYYLKESSVFALECWGWGEKKYFRPDCDGYTWGGSGFVQECRTAVIEASLALQLVPDSAGRVRREGSDEGNILARTICETRSLLNPAGVTSINFGLSELLSRATRQ